MLGVDFNETITAGLGEELFRQGALHQQADAVADVGADQLFADGRQA